MRTAYQEWKNIQAEIASDPELAAEYKMLSEIKAQQTLDLKRGEYHIQMLALYAEDVSRGLAKLRGMLMPPPHTPPA